ncbi:MAG: hypothetical protein SCALA701_00030 [Candidatus Scalindua sp.]|nr:MAG: hypothetical protein SCALA701_00030 [Candidatus Scalindua sp.]
MESNRFSRNILTFNHFDTDSTENQENIFHKILEEQYYLLMSLALATQEISDLEECCSYRKYNNFN